MPRLPLILALALAAAGALPAAAAAQSDSRPNVVFVMTDDQTAESIRVMRNVRALLREPGTTFTQTVAAYPLCCPSRATYLTGQYPHNHGVVHNIPPFGGYVRLDNANTLPVWLQGAGYETIHVGRYLNGYGTQNPDLTEIPPGWSRWVSTLDPTTFDFERWRMNENGDILERPGPENPTEHQTDYLGRRAAEEISRAAPAPEPFFLSLTFPAPHSGTPFEPGDPLSLKTPVPAPRHRDTFATARLPRTPAFDEADVRDKPRVVRRRPRLSAGAEAAITENYRQELESLQSVDDAVGTVVAALEASGELENTLIVYTADNGFFHGEHRIRSEKTFPYDASTRVPMIMRGPGIPRGHTERRPASNLDWAPTIADAADAVPGRLMDGRSLLPLLADETVRWGREQVLENGNGVRTVPRYRALRNDRFLFVRYTSSREVELYDRRRDPHELRNVAGEKSYAAVRRLLAGRLRTLARCRGARACDASRPRLKVAVREVIPPGDPDCVTGDLRVALAGRDRRRVERASFTVGRRVIGASRVTPFRRLVRAARVPSGRSVRIRARVTTLDGRVATYDRRVRGC